MENAWVTLRRITRDKFVLFCLWFFFFFFLSIHALAGGQVSVMDFVGMQWC